jgi:hypothetical protein
VPLSSEDQLRIQVMLHNSPKAIRIDENQMVLYALTPQGEASIPLSPNEPNEPYLKQLRELLSEHVLGSSGGYPLYLQRWSRMGQTGEQHLEEFLLLAEPEAVVAVANSPGLTLELARRVWWAVNNTAQQAEQGLHMLRRQSVVEDVLGREIAQFLIGHLPFVIEPEEVLSILSAVLQEGLLEQAEIDRIWRRSQERGKGIYQIAFLLGCPLSLPDPQPAHPSLTQLQQQLAPWVDDGNAVAKLLLQVATAEGQTFVGQVLGLLDSVANEVSVYALMSALGQFFTLPGLPREPGRDLGQIALSVEGRLEEEPFQPLLQQWPGLSARMGAILLLAHVREEVVFHSVLHSGAVGRSLRKKLISEFDWIRSSLQKLL